MKELKENVYICKNCGYPFIAKSQNAEKLHCFDCRDSAIRSLLKGNGFAIVPPELIELKRLQLKGLWLARGEKRSFTMDELVKMGYAKRTQKRIKYYPIHLSDFRQISEEFKNVVPKRLLPSLSRLFGKRNLPGFFWLFKGDKPIYIGYDLKNIYLALMKIRNDFDFDHFEPVGPFTDVENLQVSRDTLALKFNI